jgi:hypothetical protein
MRKICTVFIIAILFGGCVKEDKFGKSNRALIKTFVVPNQIGASAINQDSSTILVTIPETATEFILTPSEITVSNFASVSPAAGIERDFSSPVEYRVTAEDGGIRIYTVTVVRGGAQPQLDNSSFEDWYSESVLFTSVEQPGIDADNTIWATANRGLGLANAPANTTRQPIGDSSYVRLESVAAPALVRIAAATIFIGKFATGFPSVTDPRSNVTLGTPFTARPLSFSFSYTYQPGASNENDNGDPLAYGDQCDVYLLLENREGAQVKRIATAWFRSGDTVTEWTRQTIPIKYGPLEASDPWFDYAQPQEGEVWGDGSEAVTHISILATSSFEGDFFNGAIGSTFELDNIMLNY